MTDARQQIPVSSQHIRLPIDSTTGALRVIDEGADSSTARVVSGTVFHIADLVTITALGARALLLTTPNTDKRIHLGFHIIAKGYIQYILYENPTISGAGTGITAYNKNRNSAATAAMTVAYSPGVTENGTIITQGYNYDNNVNSERIDDRMWILKANEEYLLRVITPDAGSIYITTLLDWYEE